jgi:hypothetical protein
MAGSFSEYIGAILKELGFASDSSQCASLVHSEDVTAHCPY